MSFNPIKNGLGSLIHELLRARGGSTYRFWCKNVRSTITVTRNVTGSLFLTLDFFFFFFTPLNLTKSVMRILIPSRSQKENGSSAGVQLAANGVRSGPRMDGLLLHIMTSGTAISHGEPNCYMGQDQDTFGQTHDCLLDIYQPSLRLSLHHHIPFSFYAKMFPCLSVSPEPSNLSVCLSVPDITIVCALFPNWNDFILIICCQRVKLLFF